ncbi:MAG: histidine phosphatase family protein [Sphingobacteriales bacterium]|nr:histidine phosphatase family protein [Sphingobacteriales bacterium]
MRLLLIGFTLVLFSCGNTIYVVRHAEKETGIDPVTMKTVGDPPLSLAGQERALKLKEILGSKNIKHIYSTNTLRTISTAKPLKELFLDMPITIYSMKPDSFALFVQQVKSIKKGDVLIVGHSNTVDDVVNKLCGQTIIPGDLKDFEYDNLYVLKRKGSSYKFKNEKYGVSSK